MDCAQSALCTCPMIGTSASRAPVPQSSGHVRDLIKELHLEHLNSLLNLLCHQRDVPSSVDELGLWDCFCVPHGCSTWAWVTCSILLSMGIDVLLEAIGSPGVRPYVETVIRWSSTAELPSTVWVVAVCRTTTGTSSSRSCARAAPLRLSTPWVLVLVTSLAISWLRPFLNEDPCGLIAAAILPCRFSLPAGTALLPAVGPLCPAVVALFRSSYRPSACSGSSFAVLMALHEPPTMELHGFLVGLHSLPPVRLARTRGTRPSRLSTRPRCCGNRRPVPLLEHSPSAPPGTLSPLTPRLTQRSGLIRPLLLKTDEGLSPLSASVPGAHPAKA